MTSTRSDGINTLLYVFVPIQILSIYNSFPEHTELLLLFAYTALAILAHLHYAACVVSRCDREEWG